MKQITKRSLTLSLILALIFSFTLTACAGDGQFSGQFTIDDVKKLWNQPKANAEPKSTDSSSSDTDTITIASFNIQIFGKSKAGKPEVMKIITDIITQFDIVAIQEIRDKSGTAIVQLETLLDATGTDYNIIIGPRLGRTSSKEQYAYIYNTNTIEHIGEPYTYDDSAEDIFHREPYIAQFRAKNGNFDFILLTIHTDPDTATEEIFALHEVIIQSKQLTGEPDIITLGDFNADCSYHKESNKGPLSEDKYLWVIPDPADTNLAKSDCTYDRIIITKQTTSQDYTGSSGVYRFDTIHSLTYDQAKRVSDHYPVYAEFYTNRDTD